MASAPDAAELESPSFGATTDPGSLYGQYNLQRFVNLLEIPVTERFYADKAAHQKLKQKKFDLVFAESKFIFGRYLRDVQNKRGLSRRALMPRSVTLGILEAFPYFQHTQG